MKRINVNIRPNDGYWFKDADGTKFKGASWAQVIAKVMKYRKVNGRPVGDVHQEVMAQACSRHPAMCHEQRQANTQNLPTLKGRVLQWLAGFSKIVKAGQISYVREPEMQDRVKKCLGCPFHSQLPTSCAACLATIGARTVEILGRPQKPDRRVSACDKLGIYLPVAAWLDEPAIQDNGLPRHCWRRKG